MMKSEDGAMREMPKYRSHKVVWALKIKEIAYFGDQVGMRGAKITPVEEGYAPFDVDADYVNKHKPQVGGYYVVYKGGYKSYSPAEAFEAGNEPYLGDDFGWALRKLRKGEWVTRFNWNGPGQHLVLQVPDEHSKMTLPYIYIRTVQGDLVPWLASQTDMLAIDWLLVSKVEPASER